MAVRGTRTRKSVAVAVALLAVAAGGCGQQQSDRPAASGATSAAITTAPDLVRIVSAIDSEEGVGTMEVIADGNRRYRITVSSKEGVEYSQVWDGNAVLFYLPDESPQYQRIENPDKVEFNIVSFFYRAGTAEFGRLCPAAKRLGTGTLLGRTTVRYHCDAVVPSETDPAQPQEPREIALDDKTGLLMLSGGSDVPTEVTFGPAVESGTFSTELPPGADTSQITPGVEAPTDVPTDSEIGPYEIGTFRLRAVGGGFVSGTSYRGKPFVIVAGPADGIRTALRRLLPMTHGGKPPVVGFLMAVAPDTWQGSLLNPEDAKKLAESISRSAGTFAAPVGIDFKGTAAGMFNGHIAEVQPGMPDFASLVTIGFVSSDGSFPHVTLARDASDATLRNWLTTLS